MDVNVPLTRKLTCKKMATRSVSVSGTLSPLRAKKGVDYWLGHHMQASTYTNAFDIPIHTNDIIYGDRLR